jgi:hypothetical protein
MKLRHTPFGETCFSTEKEDTRFRRWVLSQAKGTWQKKVARNLLRKGYVVAHEASGQSRIGSSTYKSLDGLMNRVEFAIAGLRPYRLAYCKVGPNGGMGYAIKII